MNRYSRWKYILILATIVLAVIYALPNYFGNVRAVQISPANGTAEIGAALADKVKSAIDAAHLSYLDLTSDQTGVKIRVADTDVQLKIRDAVQTVLGPNYSVAVNLLPASPAWLSSLGALPMYLGLDLQGGVHFLMQIDMETALNKQLDHRISDVRSTLRDAKIPLAGVTREGQSLVAKFRDVDTRTAASEKLRSAMRDFQVNPLDDTRLSLTPTAESLKKFQETALQQNVLTLRNRINELGVSEPIIQQLGEDRVIVDLAGVQDSGKAKAILGRTASLEIRLVDEENSDPAHLQAAMQGLIPPGDDFFFDREGRPYLVKKTILLTGEEISNASPGFDQRNNQAVVEISLNIPGARIFGDVTRDNVGRRLAILLVEKDKTQIVTAPNIREPISTGQVQISGAFTVKDANDTALLLRAGALAAPMEIIEERTIGPSLGKDNIDKGVHSVLWGFVAIAGFMCIYYMLMGVFSTVALGVNVLLLVALLSVLQATLTLPGIAAIALTVGMAIDANVLINERIREELRGGQSPQAAIRAGYDRAFATILDLNVTNFIAGAALYTFGTGPVRGFALVLCLGIVTSMFSAILVSRALVNLVYGRQRRLTKISI